MLVSNIKNSKVIVMTRFDTLQHTFTPIIIQVLRRHFGGHAEEIFQSSPILGYLNNKTKSANKGSKARGAFANHYALYVVVEDYIRHGFADNKSSVTYTKYDGARFSDLYNRQRELPFGSKLQNHALNSRLNEEFEKYYPDVGKPPIVRDLKTQRYWIQEDLLLITIKDNNGNQHTFNIAYAIIEIIDAYVSTKKAAFEKFLETCREIAELGKRDYTVAVDFIVQQLQSNVDARVFEIVSYAILKAKYGQETVWIGKTKETVDRESLIIYKTGRTNANDGGIDFVMKPLGRFFQVTETIDVNKYFLDIDKVQRYPTTFVIKSDETPEQIRTLIRAQAVAKYKIETVVDNYMSCIEEIININDLVSAFDTVVKSNQLQSVMDEIVLQSKVEFNFINDDDEND